MSKERFKLIAAVYLVLVREDKILLLRRQNTGYQDGKFSLVAGHLDGDESASDALIREAAEEAGIELRKSDLRFAHLAHRLNRNEPNQERFDLFFYCERFSGEIINKEPEKCSELTWFPIDKLPPDTIPFVARVIDDVRNGVSYSEFSSEPQ